MEFGYLFISAMLIFLAMTGIFGLFFYENYIKKISCLAISYSSFLFFMILLSFRNHEKLSTILAIMVSVLIIFASNLSIAILISRKL